MTAPLQRVDCDFAVARPIPWDENDTLRDHVDGVVDALTATDGVVEVDTVADPARGGVRLVVVLAEPGEDPELEGRSTIASAIRAAEARHLQLLSGEEEAKFTQTLPSRSGLLTPLWRLRTIAVEPFDPESA
jgi:hypothetical protein